LAVLNWRFRVGSLKLAFWSWQFEVGGLKLAVYSWQFGVGSLELAVWSWQFGVGSPDPAARLLEIKACKANNGRAKAAIQANCTTEPNDLIVDITTASEMWPVLKEHYEG
jgi:hypothetical protein